MDSTTVLFAFLALIGFGGGAICDKLALRGLPASRSVTSWRCAGYLLAAR